MTVEIRRITEEIDVAIRMHPYFDFQISSYSNSKLTFVGSEDLSYYHTLEIVFDDVYFVSGFFQEWSSDTNSPVLTMPEDASSFNRRFEIEQGYSCFVFKVNNRNNDVIVFAASVSYNTDRVFYYDRKELKEHERVADFVIKGKTE